MIDFLSPDHPDAFVDFSPITRDDWPKDATLCPKCHGHGGWNLRLNAYWQPGQSIPGGEIPPNTPEIRHRYSHFRASCGACWGYGYLQPGQTCAHQWDGKLNPDEPPPRLGRCESLWICSKCGARIIVDSSD